MTNVNKRRHYFIDKSFQAKFILKFCLIVILSSLLIGVTMFYVLRNSTTVAIEDTRVTAKRTADFILPMMMGILLIVATLSALVVSILTLLISHKISGPLYRLKREIDILKDGDFRRNFSIRTRDQLQELSRSLNNMCRALRDKQTELKKRVAAARSSLEKDASVRPEKEELLMKFDEIDNILNFFKLG